MDNPRSIQIGKVVVILVWLFLAGSFFFPLYDWASGPAARLAFWVMLGAHVVECFVFLPALRSSGRPLAGQFGRVLVYGFLHPRSLRVEQQAAAGR